MSYWRPRAEAVIRDEIANGEREGLSADEIRKRCSEAYPFGQRRYWPYKVWLSALKQLLGSRNAPPTKPVHTPDDVKYFWVRPHSKTIESEGTAHEHNAEECLQEPVVQ